MDSAQPGNNIRYNEFQYNLRHDNYFYAADTTISLHKKTASGGFFV